MACSKRGEGKGEEFYNVWHIRWSMCVLRRRMLAKKTPEKEIMIRKGERMGKGVRMEKGVPLMRWTLPSLDALPWNKQSCSGFNVLYIKTVSTLLRYCLEG